MFRTPPSRMQWLILEGEINSRARHTKVVMRTIDHVPAEIRDPADMRSEAEFDATAELANRPCLTFLGAGFCIEHVTGEITNDRKASHAPATTKDGAATTENVRGPTAARNRVTER